MASEGVLSPYAHPGEVYRAAIEALEDALSAGEWPGLDGALRAALGELAALDFERFADPRCQLAHLTALSHGWRIRAQAARRSWAGLSKALFLDFVTELLRSYYVIKRCELTLPHRRPPPFRAAFAEPGPTGDEAVRSAAMTHARRHGHIYPGPPVELDG